MTAQSGLRPRARRPSRGFALIDALLAVAILGLASTGLIALLRQTTMAVESMGSRERDIRDASAALAAVTLRDAAWLDARIGDTRYQRWTLSVELGPTALYRLRIRDTLTGAAILETTTYRARPDSSDADR